MGKRKANANMTVIGQRVRYWQKKRGIDRESAIILAVRPRYVLGEFKAVEKLHGRKHAISFLKGKFGWRFKKKRKR